MVGVFHKYKKIYDGKNTVKNEDDLDFYNMSVKVEDYEYTQKALSI